MWLSVCHIYIVRYLHHNMYGGIWSIPYCSLLLHPLIWRNIDMGFHLFWNFLSWIHGRFMWILHDIFHDIYDSKWNRLYWVIIVSTEMHGKMLNIIASLNSAVHESTIPVIKGYSILFLNLFQLFSNKRCSHDGCIFKLCVHWKSWLLILYFVFCLCYTMYPNNVFRYVIWMINTNSIFTLNCANVAEL